jgi:hypothetical protein
VGRTPEYLGKKIGAREMKLAMVALLIHPIMILGPTGLFAATAWGMKATSNPGPHGFSQILYQFASSSANNGSALDGLGVSYGFNGNPSPAPMAIPWDIASGLVIIISRFLPIIAPIAWSYVPSEENNKVFGRLQSFVAGSAKNIQFMVKDSKKYAATGGWGFGHFNANGKPVDAAFMKPCFPCHAQNKTHDLVFTLYAP